MGHNVSQKQAAGYPALPGKCGRNFNIDFEFLVVVGVPKSPDWDFYIGDKIKGTVWTVNVHPPSPGKVERRPRLRIGAPVGSVDGGEDLRGFGMPQGELPQPMEMPGEDFRPPILKGKEGTRK